MSIKLEPKFIDSSKSARSTHQLMQNNTRSDSWHILESSAISPQSLVNIKNLAYVGQIWMGSGQKNLKKVLFDTASSYLALATIDCISCDNKYDYTTSTAYL